MPLPMLIRVDHGLSWPLSPARLPLSPDRVEGYRPRSFQELAGESHAYGLDFLVFRDLAEGQLQ